MSEACVAADSEGIESEVSEEDGGGGSAVAAAADGSTRVLTEATVTADGRLGGGMRAADMHSDQAEEVASSDAATVVMSHWAGGGSSWWSTVESDTCSIPSTGDCWSLDAVGVAVAGETPGPAQEGLDNCAWPRRRLSATLRGTW